MSDQLTTADVERELETPAAPQLPDELRRQTVAGLRKTHGHALDRLIEKAPSPLGDRLVLAKEAFTAALDLQGYGEISEPEFSDTRDIFVRLQDEQKAQAPAS